MTNKRNWHGRGGTPKATTDETRMNTDRLEEGLWYLCQSVFICGSFLSSSSPCRHGKITPIISASLGFGRSVAGLPCRGTRNRLNCFT